MNRASEIYQSRESARLREQISSIEGFTQATDQLVARASGRIDQFVRDVQSGRAAERGRARAEQRSIEQAYESAQPLIDQLQEAARAGRLGAQQYEAAIGTVEAAVREGQSFTQEQRERLLAQVSAAADPDEEGGSVTRSGRRRPRTQAQSAQGGETPAQRATARREAREGREDSEREAERALMIASFGAEAVRQLRAAFGGSSNPTPHRAGPRTGGPSGGSSTR
jgi:hypothetical protein